MNNKYENRTMWVVILTVVTMVVEIIFGVESVLAKDKGYLFYF